MNPPSLPILPILPILFRDERFVVLNKPAGLKAHPGPQGGPSVEDWFPHLSRRKTGPWLVHRLDADTAGCLIVALRRNALIEAQACMAGKTARKTYWAITQGAPETRSGRIAAPLLKKNTRTGWRMIVDPNGQDAISDWRVLGNDGGLCLIEMEPRTGRTHQIRAHLAALGCPILGDAVYGCGMADGVAGLNLLARGIHLPLSPALEATAPVPDHMRNTLLKIMPASG